MADCRCCVDRERKRHVTIAIGLAGSGEMAAVGGDEEHVSDHEVLQNDSVATVEDHYRRLDRESRRCVRHAQENSDVADRCRRVDCERKRHVIAISSAGSGEMAAVGGDKHVSDHEVLQNDSAATVRIADTFVAGPAERKETLDERHHRLDRERKRCVKDAKGNSNVTERTRCFNLQRRLQPVVVKPEKVCKFCNKFMLYKHESNGFCCGSGKLTSLDR